jgi:hypothetical protein
MVYLLLKKLYRFLLIRDCGNELGESVIFIIVECYDIPEFEDHHVTKHHCQRAKYGAIDEMLQAFTYCFTECVKQNLRRCKKEACHGKCTQCPPIEN